ncbi:MAG TPA: cytochrome b/b6 domain-containing protein [Acidobacteriaceae bacterium]|nr:cytochrome b/b6 domain-containing protein [Terriglobia bacterium]HVC89035.1 cytochrome b/b6 domain-containing protein [Acidobacteriaceae bacterium]
MTEQTETEIVPAAQPASGKDEKYYLRFTLPQRYLHAVLFTSFLGLAATGLPMRFSDNAGARFFARAVGGFGAILFFHKFCAIILTLAFLYHLKDIFTRAVVHKEKGMFWGPTSMVANWKDVKDLVGHLRWFVGLGPKPQFDRYAYWEKFDYWAVFWGMVVIGFSGYAMWFAPFFAKFLPGWALNAVLVVHGEEALLAILFIFSIHFVNTHLRPDSFPMDMVIFTGKETEEEFKKKRALEYQRLERQGKLEAKLADKPVYWWVNFAKVVGFTAILIGLVLLVLTLIAYFQLNGGVG